MTTTQEITFPTARPGNLLMRVAPARDNGYLVAFRDMVESLSLLGITRIRSLKDGLYISYDSRIVDGADLQAMLVAADAAVRFARGTHTPRNHTLPVTFEGPGSTDLSMAGLLLDTTETGLIRRICRTGHMVSALTAPAAAPVLAVTASQGMSSRTPACGPVKPVTPGTLLLSDVGLTLATQHSHSNELQVGRVAERGAAAPRLHIGDIVRFQQIPA
ncbi:carboxyltransferase domain-containing protein [Paenarthrobacter sp. NPDC057981]|uniref:carboxyltransferase domain-containing protein n=1 Tax=Paenarthrobacter sp. NPDC057981 TaxID=3346297 RepID=UPI0036D75ED7